MRLFLQGFHAPAKFLVGFLSLIRHKSGKYKRKSVAKLCLRCATLPRYMRLSTKEKPDPYHKPNNTEEVFADSDFGDFIQTIVDT